MLAGPMPDQSADEEIWAGLDYPIPDSIEIGRGTALFVAGWATGAGAAGPPRPLTILADGEAVEPLSSDMPRLEVLNALGDGYESGFWGIVPFAASGAGSTHRVEVRRAGPGAPTASAPLGSFVEAPAPAPPDISFPSGADGPKVAIAMATFNPPEDLFRAQVESIRSQTHRNWVCIISDDCSSPENLEMIAGVIGGDERFALSPSPQRLGFYANFGRALALVPGDTDFVAMADQDDRWHEAKVEILLRECGEAMLVYSDARIVDRGGAVVAGSYWGRRRNESDDLLSLLVANCVTGAASLFRAELLPDILPFPPGQFSHFHDHWIALVARSMGEIRYVDQALYDYTQHEGAVLGHEAATSMPRLGDRLRGLRDDPRRRVRMWRAHYFVDAMRLYQFATVLLMRCAGRMRPEARQALTRFLRTDRSWGELLRLSLRGSRELAGRPATLGAEWMLFRAFGWRRLLAASAALDPGPGGRLRLDAMPPLVLDPEPGRLESGPGPGPAADLGAKVAPLGFAVEADAPARVNVLVPTIDLPHFFGGYIAKFNLALALARRGFRVRVVTVDPVPALPPAWREEIAGYAGLAGFAEEVEVAFGREERRIPISPDDRFVATTWWTAHVAAEAARLTEHERFLYLIQEYEPGTFPLGSHAALAEASYRLPHDALFSSELLREYFRIHGLGVFAEPGGEDRSASFQNAITPVGPPEAGSIAGRRNRSLLFYARPEAHAARNMFELGVLGLSRAIEEGHFGEQWSFNGIGSVGDGRRLDLGGGRSLELVPRTDQAGYGEILRGHDVGLALMYTPHPSLVPLEMASAGMVTVTNSYENKTPEALAAISGNLVVAEPTVAGIAAALGYAAAAADDGPGRLAGASVAWSSSWEESFGPRALDRVVDFLEAAPRPA